MRVEWVETNICVQPKMRGTISTVFFTHYLAHIRVGNARIVLPLGNGDYFDSLKVLGYMTF